MNGQPPAFSRPASTQAAEAETLALHSPKQHGQFNPSRLNLKKEIRMGYWQRGS